MKNVISVSLLWLVVFTGSAFAIPPPPTDWYDFTIDGKQNTWYAKVFNVEYTYEDSISFEYWVDPVNRGVTGDIGVGELYTHKTYFRDYYSQSDHWDTMKIGLSYLGPTFKEWHAAVFFGSMWNHDEDYEGPVTGRLYVRNFKIVHADGTDHPIPEPGTMAMLGTGLFGMLGYEIRRRRYLK